MAPKVTSAPASAVHPHQLAEPARRGLLVVVQESDQLAARDRHAGVARGGHPGARLMHVADGAARAVGQRLHRLMGGSLRRVVDHHDLADQPGELLLGEHRAHGAREALRAAQGRDDDADRGHHTTSA
jgi:hypothetical protein